MSKMAEASHRFEYWGLITFGLAVVMTTACAGGTMDIDASVFADAGVGPDAADANVAADAGRADANVAVDANTVADAMVSGTDATPSDAGVLAACNPVTQSGCNGGEKCANVVLSSVPFVAQTACVPNGNVADGGACVTGSAGPTTGYDNCVAGFDCSAGFCSEICSQGPPDTCSGVTTICVKFENLFDDVAGEVGLCGPGCDPVAQNCSVASDGCYLQATIGSSVCADVGTMAQGLMQDDPCYGPAGGGCYLNGCAKGYGPVLNNDPVNATGSVCAFFCNPVDTYVDGTLVGTAIGDPSGIDCAETFGGARPDGPGAGYECRSIQSFYSNTDVVAATVGMCVQTPLWGNCENFDKDGFINAVNNTQSMTYCDPAQQGGVDLCPPGCVSNAIFDDWFP